MSVKTIVFTPNNCIHTKQLYSHQTIVFTPNNCIHTKQLYSHQTIVFTPNNCIHTKQLYSHQTIVFTPNNCIHAKQLYSRQTIVFTPNNCIHAKQLYSRQTIVFTPNNCIHTKQLYSHQKTKHQRISWISLRNKFNERMSYLIILLLLLLNFFCFCDLFCRGLNLFGSHHQSFLLGILTAIFSIITVSKYHDKMKDNDIFCFDGWCVLCNCVFSCVC